MPTHIDKYFPLFLKLRPGFSRTISFLAQISFGIENTARLSRTVCFLAKISVGIEVLHLLIYPDLSSCYQFPVPPPVSSLIALQLLSHPYSKRVGFVTLITNEDFWKSRSVIELHVGYLHPLFCKQWSLIHTNNKKGHKRSEKKFYCQPKS